MNEVKVYATRDQGRIHVAFDHHYQGSINSYNNWFTKFFSKAFGRSADVKVAGRTRCLNKKDYRRFLTSHGHQMTEYKHMLSETLSAQWLTTIKHLGPMSKNISKAKSEKLHKKAVRGLDSNVVNQYYVEKQVGKGADLKSSFWTRENYGISHGSITYNLGKQKIRFEGQRLTPALFAAQRGCDRVVRFMHKCCPSIILDVGEGVLFKREITSVNTAKRTSVEKRQEVKTVPVVHHRHINNQCAPVVTARPYVETKYVPVRTTTVTTIIRNTEAAHSTLFLDGDLRFHSKEKELATRTYTQNMVDRFKEDLRY